MREPVPGGALPALVGSDRLPWFVGTPYVNVVRSRLERTGGGTKYNIKA